jgi:hypothetical protein
VVRILKAITALFLVAGLPFGATGQEQAGTLPNYLPLLPQVKATATPIDPQKGYAVKELKPEIYMITEGSSGCD